jgi:hypothetical protein
MIKNKIQISIRNFLLDHPYFNPYGFTTDRFFRNITNSFRLLPNFLIIGYYKSGTTSLYDYLIQHENIGRVSRKEIQYFSFSYWRGLKWYRSHFPTNFIKRKIESKTCIKFLVGEASPQYIFHPYSLERIHKILPKIKLIVLLRNPIDRAYSHYMHQVRLGNEYLNTFEEAIELDGERFHEMFSKFKNNEIREYSHKFYPSPYIKMGQYIFEIKKLYETFPKDQILILKSSDLNKFPSLSVNKVLKFLDLPISDKINFTKKNIGKYTQMNPKTREKLIEHYKPYNSQLENFLDTKFDWNK